MAANNRSTTEDASLYLRMSGEKQEKSIPTQRAELQRYAERHGYRIVAEYSDEAISGDKTEKRRGFLAMRDASSSGEFSVILAWDQDRFGRFDLIEGGFWIQPFREAGVRLETVAQGRIDWEDLAGQLIYSVNQMGKAQYLRDLSRNSARGLLAYAREARSGTGGSTPYGYRVKNGKVRVQADEAKIVRRIFREYLQPGSSLRGVASRLNRDKIPSSSGGVWRAPTVRAILNRKKYTGCFVFGRENGGSYHALRDGEIIPRRKSDRTVSAEPIEHQDQFKAIVSRKIFDQVQAKLRERKRETAPKRGNRFLLSSLLRCGDCDGRMSGRSRYGKKKYVCTKYRQVNGCNHNSIDEAPLVACLLAKIQERYSSETSIARLRKAIETELEREAKPAKPREINRLKREIEKLDRKIDQGAERVLEVPSDLVSTVVRKLEKLREERDQLKVSLEALACRESKAKRGKASIVEQALEALKNLGEALETAKPEEGKELLAGLVSSIELHFDHKQSKAGRMMSEFSHGVVYLRPEALSRSDSTQLNKTRVAS